MSAPKNASQRLRWREPLNALRALTDTSPNRIMPQKAHAAIAQTQASNGDEMSSFDSRTDSMAKVMGGRGGFLRRPCWRRSIPLSDQLMVSWSAEDRGAGQPCTMCHARTAVRYLRATETATGSIGTWNELTEPMAKGSAVAQRTNE